MTGGPTRVSERGKLVGRATVAPARGQGNMRQVGRTTATENIFTGGAKSIFTGSQAHRLYQGSVQNGPQYRRGCVSRL